MDSELQGRKRAFVIPVKTKTMRLLWNWWNEFTRRLIIILLITIHQVNLNWAKLFYLHWTLCRTSQLTNDFLAELHFSLELLDTLLKLPVLNAQAWDVIVLIGNLIYEGFRVADIRFLWKDFVCNLLNVSESFMVRENNQQSTNIIKLQDNKKHQKIHLIWFCQFCFHFMLISTNCAVFDGSWSILSLTFWVSCCFFSKVLAYSSVLACGGRKSKFSLGFLLNNR